MNSDVEKNDELGRKAGMKTGLAVRPLRCVRYGTSPLGPIRDTQIISYTLNEYFLLNTYGVVTFPIVLNTNDGQTHLMVSRQAIQLCNRGFGNIGDNVDWRSLHQ